MFAKIRQNKFGLTLIETVIALGILMMGILSSLVLMYTSFDYVQQTESEIVVVNLAREGIELVRAMRNKKDFNLFNEAYLQNYYDGSYIIDINTTDLDSADYISTDITNCTKCELYLNGGRYIHNRIGTDVINTGIKRLITIQSVSSHEKIIISEISWTIKSKTHTYSLQTHLTDWQSSEIF